MPVGVALGGWAVMVVAMMLPPALPLLDLLRGLLVRHRHAALLIGAGAAISRPRPSARPADASADRVELPGALPQHVMPAPTERCSSPGAPQEEIRGAPCRSGWRSD